MAVYDSSPIAFRFDRALPSKFTIMEERTLYVGATIRGDILGETMDFCVIEITANYAGTRATVVAMNRADARPFSYFVEWSL